MFEYMSERECNKCVYHTSGSCSSWSCMGIKTIEDVRADAIDEFVALINTMPIYENADGEKMPMPIEMMAEQLKEKKK